MKKILILLLLLPSFAFAPHKDTAFGVGEYFKMRVHYGIVNAGYATMEVREATKNNKKVYHAVGRGYTTGMSRFFFKVEDNYESYFDKKTGNPYHFIRKIDEGGYIKNQEGFFDHDDNKVLVKDHKRKTQNTYSIPRNTQDILSSFYYLRNHSEIDNLRIGESVIIDMFFDDETTKFKLKYVGNQDIKTKFGTIPTMVFKPLVQSGRVFKEEESLTVWVSDDENKLPVRIQASLAVGSLKADLDSFRGLKHSLKIKR
ncbi:MAG: DUF3108 domain-containing protein [Flavobacterium sp.]|nr:DUF3108 domain-containing protein [Flavobacterium sp.]